MIPGDGPKLLRDAELPDTTLPESKRSRLKVIARDLSFGLDEHELMFLAGALEDKARKKRRTS